MTPFCALAAATGLATALLLVAEKRHHRLSRWVTKTVASLAFVAAGYSRMGGAPSAFEQAVLAGLCLSLLGDVLLLEDATFLLGLGSLLLGHVAFSVAFVMRGVAPTGTALAAVPVVIIALVIGRWLLPHVKGAMRGPVVAYMTVITAMVTLSVGSYLLRGNLVVVAAATAFFLSDISVARDRFVHKEFANRLWGLPLYYAAQLLFAWTIGTR